MGGELAEAPALGPHPRSLPGVLVMHGGTKQDGDAKLSLGGRGRGEVGEGVRPFPLSPLPTGRAGEGVLPLWPFSHQHSKSWWGHSPHCHSLPWFSLLSEMLRDLQPTFIGHLTGASLGVMF